MKKEFSQMALDFGMAEPAAPPPTAIAPHNGKQGNGLGLSAEEEQAVHEEGPRTGVVVRTKSPKKAGPPLGAEPVPVIAELAASPDPIQLPMFGELELLPAPEPVTQPNMQDELEPMLASPQPASEPTSGL